MSNSQSFSALKFDDCQFLDLKIYFDYYRKLEVFKISLAGQLKGIKRAFEIEFERHRVFNR